MISNIAFNRKFYEEFIKVICIQNNAEIMNSTPWELSSFLTRQRTSAFKRATSVYKDCSNCTNLEINYERRSTLNVQVVSTIHRNLDITQKISNFSRRSSSIKAKSIGKKNQILNSLHKKKNKRGYSIADFSFKNLTVEDANLNLHNARGSSLKIPKLGQIRRCVSCNDIGSI